MKANLDNMEYREFIEYLNTNNINYEKDHFEPTYSDKFIFQITPMSKKLMPRFFDKTDGSQITKSFNEDLMRFVDGLSYKEFIEFLYALDVKYKKTKCITYSEFYIIVKPINSFIRKRRFSISYKPYS